MKKIFAITLGCAKTRVDTEYLLGMLENENIFPVNNPSDADLLLVNTCSFIESARVESIDTILELLELKQSNQTMCITGCLPSRYGNELKQEFGDVEIITGCGDLDKISEFFIKGSGFAVTTNDSWIPDFFIPRKSSLNRYCGYLKIAEGCDRKCSYCAIPGIRGPQKSLKTDLIISEANHLVQSGLKDINIIAQDTTSWGSDTGENLFSLLSELDKISGEHIFRLLYLYPDPKIMKIAEFIDTSEHFAPYLDIPVQHISDNVLKKMSRGYRGEYAWKMFDTLRKKYPHIYLRTTIMTGHPGESLEDFNLLKKFIRKISFDHLGVFAYSPEEGTRAYPMSHTSVRSALARKKSLMELQKTISRENLLRFRDTTLKILVEEYDEENMIFTGRHSGQAPETDGIIYLSDGDYKEGTFVDVKITDTDNYDLVGVM
ncbi:MAG: 30S ribosomal protein S12 methylthiotransferase RimO [Deltaproteobacteria bacterium]|nr:30S ribosomal protein S12 methylthiotransferase RimO [Deltaproteobacteria bacterium]